MNREFLVRWARFYFQTQHVVGGTRWLVAAVNLLQLSTRITYTTDIKSSVVLACEGGSGDVPFRQNLREIPRY